MVLEQALIAAFTPAVRSVAQKVADKLRKEAPPAIEEKEGLKLQSPDKRLSWAITKREGQYLLAVLVEKDNSWAQRKAQEIQEDNRESVIVAFTGLAHSSRPQNPVKVKREDKMRPGLSVGHYRGYAGTLGCLVMVRSEPSDYPALASASHVLAMNNSADKADPVLHPGHPDGSRTLGNKIGTIRDFTYLVHHQMTDDISEVVNTEDIGVVKLDDDVRIETTNLVPNPKEPNRRIKLKGYVPAEQLFERVSEPVYKIGRTTGLTKGILDLARVDPRPIRLPDRKTYIYGNLAAVCDTGKKAFSQPGDSGSIVYTSDGMGLGFIVGASDEYTYILPLSTCLSAVNAELLV